MNARRNQRGVALVMVLWLGAMIVLLAGAYGYGTRSESRVIEELRQASVLRAASEAALHYVAIELGDRSGNSGDEAAADKIPLNGRPWEWTFSGQTLEVRVTGTGGLVDLNRAPRPLLEETLLFAGLTGGEVQAVVDALDAEFQEGPLEDFKELGTAAGLDRMRLDRLVPLMTMHGGRGIDPAQAPLAVLEMFSGGDTQLAADLVGRNNDGAERTIPSEYRAAGGTRNYVVTVAVPHTSKRSLTAVIGIPGRDGQLYALLE